MSSEVAGMSGYLRDATAEPIKTLRGLGGVSMAKGDEGNDPRLYQQLKDGWIAAGLSPDEWHDALREACRNREYWLESLIKSVGLHSVVAVVESVLLDLDVARAKGGA